MSIRKMAIKITVNKAAAGGADVEEVEEVQATVRLKAHKTLDGNILIKDHDMMDIVVIPVENKVMTLPKFGLGEEVYYYQKFLLDSLARTGVIGLTSVQGGIMRGVLEGTMVQSVDEDISPLQVVLYEIEKFMKQYSIEEQFGKDYEVEIEDRFINPDPDESTEYGEIEPEQTRRKHSQSDLPYYTFAGYGYMF